MMRYFIFFIIIVAFIDTFSQLPIMSPFAKSIHPSPAFIGLIVGMYSFSNMIGNVLAGYWIDKSGAKKVLVSGLASTGSILILYTLADSPLPLIAIRFLHGLFGGLLVPAAFTAIANKEKTNKQGKSMALSGAAVGASAILGPAFGAVVASKYSANWVFLLIAAAMISSAVFTFAFLPSDEKPGAKPKDPDSARLFPLIREPMLAVSYAGAFSLMFAQGTLAYLLPLQVESLQFNSVFSGILLSSFGLTAILIFLLPINKMFDRYKHENMMMAGMVIISLALILLGSATSLAFMFFCMVLYGTGFAFMFPSINAIIAKHTTEKTRGKAFGLFYAFFSLGVVAGSTLLGLLAATFRVGFAIAAFVLIINVLGTYFYFKKNTLILRRQGGN